MLPNLRPSSVSRRGFWSFVLLCAVQGLERFAFVAMLPLFVIYLQERHAIPVPAGLLVLAVFQALSQLGGLPAGWLADRKLGVRASTLLGAGLLMCSYAGLSMGPSSLLWPALGLMVAGHSFFRTGLHVLIGNAARGDESARERVFLWQYLAINVGYAAGGLFGEWAHAHHGWPWLFGGAALAATGAVASIATGWSWLPIEAAAAAPASAQARTPSTTERMRAIWLLCGVAVVFWLAAQQAGSSLALFAALNTVSQVTVWGRSFQMGPGHFASLHGLMVLAMLPAFLAVNFSRRGQQTSTTGNMVWGYVATAAAFVAMAAAGLDGGDAGRVSGGWLVGCYLFLSLAEVLLAPLGVSLLMRLAPTDKAGQAVGLWFAGCAIGNGLAGALGLSWDRWPHHRYFALLALLALGAAAVLLPRRRRLDWLTALSTSASVQPDSNERKNPMTTTPELNPHETSHGPLTPKPVPSPIVLGLASLAIVLPGAVAAIERLPLLVRGSSAIVSGLALLLCGSYLLGQMFEHLARSQVARHGQESDSSRLLPTC